MELPRVTILCTIVWLGCVFAAAVFAQPAFEPGDVGAIDQPAADEPVQPHFGEITYHRCLDADTCVLTIPKVQRILGARVAVRLDRIDTPHLKGKCEREQELAAEARDLLHGVLSEAGVIEVFGHYLTDIGLTGRVVADGQDLSELLIAQGFAVTHERGGADWCAL